MQSSEFLLESCLARATTDRCQVSEGPELGSEDWQFPCDQMFQTLRGVQCFAYWTNIYLAEEDLEAPWVPCSFAVWCSILAWFLFPDWECAGRWDATKTLTGVDHRPSQPFWPQLLALFPHPWFYPSESQYKPRKSCWSTLHVLLFNQQSMFDAIVSTL